MRLAGRWATSVGLAVALVGVGAAVAVVNHEAGPPPTVGVRLAGSRPIGGPGAAGIAGACAAPGKPVGHASAPSTNEVPAGAVLARLCPVTGRYSRSWSAPLDALTTNLDLLAAAYNSQPLGQALPCPAPAPTSTAFTITFVYPSGALIRLGAESSTTGGCSLIGLAGRNDLGRANAGDVLAAYLHLLGAQRASETPPSGLADAVPLGCGGPRTGFPPGILPPRGAIRMARAVVCTSGGLPGEEQHTSTTLSGAAIRIVEAEYRWWAGRRTSRPPGCLNPDPTNFRIVGVTAWGDRVELSGFCGVFTRAFARPAAPVWLHESSAMAHAIDPTLH